MQRLTVVGRHQLVLVKGVDRSKSGMYDGFPLIKDPTLHRADQGSNDSSPSTAVNDFPIFGVLLPRFSKLIYNKREDMTSLVEHHPYPGQGHTEN